MAPISFDPHASLSSPKHHDQASVALLHYPAPPEDEIHPSRWWKYGSHYPCFAWGFYCVAAAAAALAVSLVYCTVFRFSHAASAPRQAEISRPLKVLDKPLVILVSSDGFRWGYQWKVPTPNIDRLRLNGTEAEPGLIPVFPTLTFPNHYSIATGLYPAWHGIISNYFHYPVNGNTETFYMGNLDPKWWLGEPIWQTVTKAGLKAATFFWPGSEVVKGPWNCPPSLCRHYNGSVPYEDRVDTVLGYLDLPPWERPSFMSLYFESPDKPGHEVGPDAPQISEAIERIDAMIGRLLDGLEQRNVLEDVSIIMVGDHGMVGTCDKKLIYLHDLAPWISIPSSWIDSTSPVLAIRPPSDVDAKEVVKKMSEGLSSGKVENGNFLKVYLKEDLPERLHYSDSARIQPIIGLIAEAFKVEEKRSKAKECGGAHGYDNEFASMRTIFIGHGPRFAKGRKVPSFINVELYNVMTTILGIEAAPNNGSLSFVNSLLLP
ncbi:hypothetical protein O6H91_01G144900 [Diphasiastrum complanatum]|uniref:Uncharacterized protein n=1 Tax=Diphasiastrum complanatum TaxID=34168 RepID=A0ACC2EX07_DIPCM|nr:hypothetical protein O6H91_01G144900 [Diphasiastrum complanatum]